MLVFLISVVMPHQPTVQAEEYVSIDSGLNVKGRSLLPMRTLFESLGATIDWNQKTKTVTAKKDQTTIVLTIGEKKAKVNGKIIQIDVPAQVIEGSTYVPVRFVTESLGAKVEWDSKLNRATVYYENMRIDVYVKQVINVSGVEKKFRPNPSYMYVYIPYEGRLTETFVGMKGNTYVWNSQYSYVEDYPVERVYYTENQYGLYTSNGTTSIRLIKYPAYAGQSWTTEAYGESTTHTIVDVGLTLKTRVKTFENVIKIIDDEGNISYYAEEFGFVEGAHETVDFGAGLIELKKR